MKHQPTRARLAVALTFATAGAVVLATNLPAQGSPTSVDPALLRRGPDPAVTYMVRDTIRDGARSVSATRWGQHLALWNTARGYVVKDQRSFHNGRETVQRLVYVSPTGHKRVITHSAQFSSATAGTAVSQSGRRIAWSVQPREADLWTVVKVANPNTGRLIAHHGFRLGQVVSVTGARVLVTHAVGPRFTSRTFWWNYRRDTVRKYSTQKAASADLGHDRVVFDLGSDGDFCNRVAVLSRPAHTLWRSCRIFPHQWSPDGALALATHTYFDAAGTDRWLTIGGRTATPIGRVTGRLGWHAVWEDSHHFLTVAQGESGKAAIIRCTTDGTCERASRLWDDPLPQDPSVFYVAPPVLLASN